MSEPRTSSEAPPSPEKIIEAVLFASGEPLTPERAGEIVRHLTPDQFRQIVDSLNRTYRRQHRPYTIQCSDIGSTLMLRPQFHALRERLEGSTREAKLTPAALDVLALIAYRQPITRAEIDSLRGADSRSAIQQLTRVGLTSVERRQVGDETETVYSTTKRFLELFGLGSLADLPHIGDLQQI